MGVAKLNLDHSFKLLEDKAKDSTISNENLTDNLAYFLKESGYERTPYRMEFEGFYRARAKHFDSVDAACTGFGNVKFLSYPPDAVAEASRCNLKGHAVFYCSSETGVPVYEVRPETGQYIVVASFIPKNDPKLELILPIIGVKQIRESLLKYDRRDWMITMLENDMHYKKEHSQALDIDSRLAEWFVAKIDDSNRHIYRLTTAYYNGLVKYGHAGTNRVTSLIYPRVESGISGYNHIMEKEVARDFLKVKDATIYQVQKILPEVIFLKPKKQIK